MATIEDEFSAEMKKKSKSKKKKKYAGSYHCQQINPVKDEPTDSVGLIKTREQAKEFGEGLIRAAQDPNPAYDKGIAITGWRGTKRVTIISIGTQPGA